MMMDTKTNETLGPKVQYAKHQVLHDGICVHQGKNDL